MNFKDFIEQSLTSVAPIAKKNFLEVKTVTVKEGDNNQVLTETDIEIGKLLVEAIQQTFPDHNIIDEEAGVIDKKSEYTWTVDPIDGTSNFASGLPTYGIFLGLLHNSEPIAGGIALPSLNELYVGEKGQGVYLNGERVQVTSEEKLSNALIAYGIDGYPDDPERTQAECRLLADIVVAIRNLRVTNSPFDQSSVIAGRMGAQLNKTSKIWDNVPVDVLVHEAGGVYTDFSGNSIDYSNHMQDPERNYEYIVAAPQLHKQLLAIIKQHES